MSKKLRELSWKELNELTENNRFDITRDQTYTTAEARRERDRRLAEERRADEQNAKERGRLAEKGDSRRQRSRSSDRGSHVGTSKSSGKPLGFGAGLREVLDAMDGTELHDSSKTPAIQEPLPQRERSRSRSRTRDGVDRNLLHPSEDEELKTLKTNRHRRSGNGSESGSESEIDTNLPSRENSSKSCRYCGKDFAQKSARIRHERESCKMNEDNAVTLLCPIKPCLKTASRRENLEDHIKRRHEKEYPGWKAQQPNNSRSSR
jgi:hypothetical protein